MLSAVNFIAARRGVYESKERYVSAEMRFSVTPSTTEKTFATRSKSQFSVASVRCFRLAGDYFIIITTIPLLAPSH